MATRSTKRKDPTMAKTQSVRAKTIRANRAARTRSRGVCPIHGNATAGMPKLYSQPYRFTCGCETGQTRGRIQA